MENFDIIFQQATENIESEFYQLPVAGKEDPIYRERVYCYELYHQLRSLWPIGTEYTLSGEVDKKGHPLIRNNGLDDKKPDFLIHVPGNMGQNYLVVEVKQINTDRREIFKDLKTLTAFRLHGQYQRAILLFYGLLDEGFDKIRTTVNGIVNNEGVDLVRRKLIELWHHPAPATIVQNENW